ncbi:hypothetical protein R5R35_004845 [Gryllus longicercus]|uniref:C2H2-type domain-containing protein n=1 Tax=Gryllus longicercus TaxID=2509291 RepID=A0AAN9Z9L7_9ORTH
MHLARNQTSGLICSRTGENAHSCSVCGNAFSEKSTLVTHMRTHTGERPHSCSVCSKAFSEKYKPLDHNRTHTGERTHKQLP